MTKATTLSQPFYKIRPPTLSSQLPSVQIMSADILPTSIPLDASKYFSSALEPSLKNLIYDTMTPTPNGTLPPDLERATIASNGVLAEKHQWLQPSVDDFRNSRQKEETPPEELSDSQDAEGEIPPMTTARSATGYARKKRILLLGSGMVAAPAVDFIAQRTDVELLVGMCNTIQW